MEAQQEKIGIKMLFRQAEMNALLKSCTTGLEQAADIFGVIFGSAWVCELTKQQYGRLIVLISSRISM
jgi:hypothetical protein